MSQTEFETADKKPPEAENTEGSDLFKEALFSGKEIEGLFEKKRREEMLANTGKRSSKKRGANGVKDPLSISKERVAIYNKKRDEEFHLVFAEEDLSYHGLLKFKYHNGYQPLSESINTTNSDTAAAIVPMLIKKFLPRYDLANEASGSCISLSQGGSERELEATEKPLEIALDCSTKGLSPPSFALKTTPSLLIHSTLPQKRMENKVSALSLQTSSLSSLGHTSSEGSESPKVNSPYVTYEDHDSLYSFSSTSSIPSSISNQHNGSRSPHSLFKPRSQSKPGQKLTFESTYHKMSEPVLNSCAQGQHLTPELSCKGGKPKSRVGNFMEGVARTLKSRKKVRPTSIYPEGGVNEMPDPRKSALVSPNMADRKFSIPTVFHIYYSKAQNMQLYKSVLVSKYSTARDVIKQSLERYGLKFVSPESFLLFEVIGRWEEISETSESTLGKSLQVESPTERGGALSGKQQLLKPTRAFEEFVECYTRKLSYDEKPYDVQFFHEPPSGYTRRFELKSSSSEEALTPSTAQKSPNEILPTTPVFGTTSHNIHRSARERSKSQDTFDFSVETEEEQDEESSQSVQSGTLGHSFVDCSSPDGLPTQLSTCELYPAITSGIFLLNLQLVPSEKEFLVYRILHGKFVLKNVAAGYPRVQYRQKSLTPLQSEAYVNIAENELESVLFTITKNQQHTFIIEPECSSISVNGKSITETSKLHHGDLIKVGDDHLFMFQNHSHGGVATAHWPYMWRPTTKRSLQVPIEIQTSHGNSATVVDTASTDEVQLSAKAQIVHISSCDELSSLPTVQEVDYVREEENSEDLYRRRASSDTRVFQKHATKNAKKNKKTNYRELQSPISGQLKRDNNNKLGVFPADRKLMFSYNMEEEDTLLQLLIDDLDPTQVVFSLAPAYVLCMCMEYSMRCSGPRTASRLACKAVERIQKNVSRVTSEILSWKPATSQSKPYPSLDEISNPICSILFWLANSLELYNFLLTQDVLDLSVLVHGEHGEDQQEENAMTLLENMMQHLFQHAFYPVSKALYVILPKMLEEGNVSKSCVHYAVTFLKGILELMFELHIHTETIAQFFANIFFFLNGAMFNAFIDQGPHLDLFQFYNGAQLRAKLDILENWAGREGFRDGPLQFLAVFSSAVDLVATPPDELLKLSWSVLREEFPALLPSQLHFILAHYLLPEYVDVPTQWTPTPEEGRSATDNGSLHESFESHPQFEVPIGGYLLDLDSQSCDNHMLHEFVDSLRKELKRREKSVDIVKIKKECPNIAVPTMIYSTNTYPPSPTSQKKKPLLNIAEIVTSDLKTSQKASSRKSHQCNKSKSHQSAELRGRVKSIVEPHFRAPEKLVILFEKRVEQEFIDEEEEEEQEGKFFKIGGMESPTDDLPMNTQTLCLQRGNNGFGFTTESRKDPITGANHLFISSLVKDGGIAEITDIAVGYQILAVDDLNLETASHSEIQQYIKDAEEEITLVVCCSGMS